MVLDDELRPCHQLTKQGEEQYRIFLEQEADEILLKHEHPFRWMMLKIKELLT